MKKEVEAHISSVHIMMQQECIRFIWKGNYAEEKIRSSGFFWFASQQLANCHQENIIFDGVLLKINTA